MKNNFWFKLLRFKIFYTWVDCITSSPPISLPSFCFFPPIASQFHDPQNLVITFCLAHVYPFFRAAHLGLDSTLVIDFRTCSSRGGGFWTFPCLCSEYLLLSVLLLFYKYFWDYNRIIALPLSLSLLQTLPCDPSPIFQIPCLFFLTSCYFFLSVTCVTFHSLKRENYASEF